MNTVVQVVQHLKPGGIETMVLDLNSFCEDNEKSIIISLEGNLEEAIDKWPRLEKYSDNIIFLDKKPGITPALIFKLTRLFKLLNVSSVHTHHIGPLLYAGIAARLSGIKSLIHTEHDAWHLNDRRRLSLQRWVIRLSRPLLVADAKVVADKMSDLLKLKEIQIIHNGIDTERFTPGDKDNARSILNIKHDIKLIGCSGRLEKVKGQKSLIQALSKLPINIHLALAGIGSTENELRSLTDSLNLSERVHFLGRIDDMPTFYRALDVFCLPSLNEGFPLSPLEAQSCNIQTLVTDVGGSCETLCPQSGNLVPSSNLDAMASTLLAMLEDSISQSTINPRDFVQKQADVRRMVRAYSNLRYQGV